MSDREFHDGHYWISIVCSHCGRRKDVPAPCGDRFCSVCNRSRQMRTRRRLRWMLSRVKQHGQYKFAFLTLTMPPQDDCQAMVAKLQAAFKQLRKTKYWRKNVEGGAFVIEIKRGSGSNQWHCHIHAILLAKRLDLTNRGVIRRLWKRQTQGTSINLRLVRSHIDVLNYMTKYVTKTELNDADRLIASKALKGKRLFQPFGTFYNASLGMITLPARCGDCGRAAFMLYHEVYANARSR